MEYEFKGLFNRLNKVCRSSYNSALHNCQNKKHYSLEVEDFLLRLLDRTDTDAYQILRYYELDRQTLIRQLESTIAMKKRAPDAMAMVSPQIYELLSQAWLISSLILNEGQIRSGSIILALVNSDSFRGLLLEKCTLFLRIPRQILLDELGDIVRTSEEKCLTPAHLQVVPANEAKSTEPVKQHASIKEHNIKTFKPKPDEAASEDYKDLYSRIQEIHNQTYRNNILLIDTPDIEFNNFLCGITHYMNAGRPGVCEVKLLRLATEPKYRRDNILLDLARHGDSQNRAYLYITDTVDFSETIFEQLQDICANNKVRFVFHDTLNHTINLPWLKNYLTVTMHHFEDMSAIKRRFMSKLKRFESHHNLNTDSDAKHLLYSLAYQYSKGSPWNIGERLLQEIVTPKVTGKATQLSLYPTSEKSHGSLTEGDSEPQIVTREDIFSAAKASLNKFIDLKSLSHFNSNAAQGLQLHKDFADKLHSTISDGPDIKALNLLSGGSHSQRFYNAQKAAIIASLGHQRLVVLAQNDSYDDCSQAVVETLLRYRAPNLFIDFDTTSSDVLINLLQDIEAGYITYGGMKFSLRQATFYFSTNHSSGDSAGDVTTAQVIKQYAGPWIKQHLNEYSFQQQATTPSESVA